MPQTSLAGWLKKQQPLQQKTDNVTTTSTDTSATTGPEPEDGLDSNDKRTSDEAETEETLRETITKPPTKSLAINSFPPLPPNATLAPITADTLPSFKRMTSLLLPIPYPETFYNDTVTDPIASSISLVALWSSPPSTSPPRVVAGIRCRLISHPLATSPAPSLYISTITTLAPFRGHGLARALLRKVIAGAVRDYGVATVTAHMWEANVEAQAWYEKMGFEQVKFDERYYRKLKPSGAWLLERRVGVADLLGE